MKKHVKRLDTETTSIRHLRSILMSALIALVVAHTAAFADVPFLRGDANGDGAVTISDAVALTFVDDDVSDLCLDAADADDDGVVGYSDAALIFRHVSWGDTTPCAPYPELGEDEWELGTGGHPERLGCEQYGAGMPFEDPGAVLEIRDPTVDDDGHVTLTVRVSSARSLGGFSGVLSVDGDIFAEAPRVPAVDLRNDIEIPLPFSGSYSFPAGAARASVRNGKLHFAHIAGFLGLPLCGGCSTLDPGEDVAVVAITACLKEGIVAGNYALTLEVGELADETSGRAIHPLLASGTITVPATLHGDAGCPNEEIPPPEQGCLHSGAPDETRFLRGDVNIDGRLSISDALLHALFVFQGEEQRCFDAADANDDGSTDISDSTFIMNYLFLGGQPPPAPFPEVGLDETPFDDLSCVAYDVVEPEATQDLVELGDFRGEPGETVEISVRLTNSIPIQAYLLVARYDPTVLILDPYSNEISFEGTFFEGKLKDASLLRTFRAFPEEGVFVVSFLPSLTAEPELATPPGTNRLVFKLVAQISPDAPEGTETILEPIVAPESFGPDGLRCELSAEGDALYVSVLAQFSPGSGGVGPDVMIYRGDADDDGSIELTDAVFTLNWLFLGSPRRPRCLDAADADDSGEVDLTDAVYTLSFLFLGGPPPAPPYPEIAEDKTEDTLPGCSYTTAPAPD